MFKVTIFCILTSIALNIFFLKFAENEVSKWTNLKTAKKSSAIKLKWLLINISFIIFFSYCYLDNYLTIRDEFEITKESFRVIFMFVWISSLNALSQLDFNSNLLPDKLTISLGMFGLLFSILYDDETFYGSIISGLIGMLFILSTIFLFYLANFFFQKINLNSNTYL